jgi:hypothetical protein
MNFITADTFIKAVAGALGGHLSIIARDIHVKLKFNAGVTSKQATCGSYKVMRSLTSDMLELSLGCLYIGESRDMVIKLSLAECTNSAHTQEQELFVGGATYINIDSEPCCAVIVKDNVARTDLTASLSNAELLEALQHPKPGDPLLAATVLRVPNKREHHIACNVEVDAHLQRFAVFAHLERVISWADAQNFTAAEQEIEDLRKNLVTSIACTNRHGLVTALLQDLDACSADILDEDSYVTNGGSVHILAFNKLVASQRCVFNSGRWHTEGVYQSLSSHAMQVTASSLLFTSSSVPRPPAPSAGVSFTLPPINSVGAPTDEGSVLQD